ncbi:MAG: D-alanine--poly(phosphoribitol) ligase subunit DltA [Gemmatimonadota bacterium]|nr:D-alanine--poly(phosphoribitol) ligase subunit DltA [Gemmatimonadota bacterium]
MERVRPAADPITGSVADPLARIDSWGRAAPERIAHASGGAGGRTLTWGELLRRADALAAHVARTLPDDGFPVAVLGHKEPEMLIAFLGCAKAARAYVPLDTSLPRQRVERILATSGARLVLTPESIVELSSGSAAAPAIAATPDTPHYVIFTSGSTGEPKGVVITRGCLAHFLGWLLGEQAFGDGEVFLNQAAFSFDLSVMDLYASLTTGGTLVSVTREEAENPMPLFRALAASRVTVWVSTPTFAQMCLAERRFARGMLPHVRKFLFCGETLPPAVAAQLLERFPDAEVWNTYGPTEATVATTSIRITPQVLAGFPSLPVGRAMPGTRVLVLDDSLAPVPDGERGEIVIAGPNVSPGYLHRPDLTARAFFELDGVRAYRTGDWGTLNDGLLFFGGRLDDQIKLHGYRIELGDVEANLRALPGVRDAAVIPAMRDGAVTGLTAFIVLDERPPGSDFEIGAAIRARLAERLPAHMLPRRFHFLDRFPATPNGKVDRRELAESVA